MKLAYYETASGDKPVKEALDELADDRPEERRGVLRKRGIIRGMDFDEARQAGHIKHIRGKISELKVHGRQSRVLGFMWRGYWMAAVHTIKKTDELDERYIELAEERREDWYERHE